MSSPQINLHTNDVTNIKQMLNMLFPSVLTNLIMSYYTPWCWKYMFTAYIPPSNCGYVISDNVVLEIQPSGYTFIKNIETSEILLDDSNYMFLGCFEQYVYYYFYCNTIFRMDCNTKKINILCIEATIPDYCLPFVLNIKYIKNFIFYVNDANMNISKYIKIFNWSNPGEHYIIKNIRPSTTITKIINDYVVESVYVDDVGHVAMSVVSGRSFYIVLLDTNMYCMYIVVPYNNHNLIKVLCHTNDKIIYYEKNGKNIKLFVHEKQRIKRKLCGKKQKIYHDANEYVEFPNCDNILLNRNLFVVEPSEQSRVLHIYRS